MDVDEKENYLGTGDVNGLVKIWNIKSYCLKSNFKIDSIVTDERIYIFLKKNLYFFKYLIFSSDCLFH